MKIKNICNAHKKLGLPLTEFNIMVKLKEEGKEFSIKDLMETLNKDRTTIQKSINKLLAKEVVLKRQINLDRGFMYVFKYNYNSTFIKDKVKELTEEIKGIKEFFKNNKFINR